MKLIKENKTNNWKNCKILNNFDSIIILSVFMYNIEQSKDIYISMLVGNKFFNVKLKLKKKTGRTKMEA